MSSIIINNSCKVQKTPIYGSTVSLYTFRTLELLFPISKKEFILVLFQFPKTIVLNFLLHYKIHHS